MADKDALIQSQAGMRFIAQMTLYNSGNAERLAGFITNSYHETALQERPADVRLGDMRAMLAQHGKGRVYQVLATDKHQVVVLMQMQQTKALYMAEMIVEEDYPHRITTYTVQPLRAGIGAG